MMSKAYTLNSLLGLVHLNRPINHKCRRQKEKTCQCQSLSAWSSSDNNDLARTCGAGCIRRLLLSVYHIFPSFFPTSRFIEAFRGYTCEMTCRSSTLLLCKLWVFDDNGQLREHKYLVMHCLLRLGINTNTNHPSATQRSWSC